MREAANYRTVRDVRKEEKNSNLSHIYIDTVMGTFLISGATGGIGSAIGHRLHEQGHQLALFSRNAEKLASMKSTFGERVITIAGDAQSPDDLTNAVTSAKEAFGELSGAAHAVGSIMLKPLSATTAEEFEQQWRQNTLSAFNLLKAVMPILQRARGGSVVLYSSVASEVGIGNHEAIGSAKAGVVGLARAAAASATRYGVRVNVLAPGLTRTPLSSFITENELSSKASLAMHPLGRLGEPEDIASATAFLLSGDASWITGQVIPVDGGLTGIRK